MGECNPSDYLTIEAHADHCKLMKEWADTVVETSKLDRLQIRSELEKIDRKVVDLEKLIPRFQWWFIGILVAIIITSYVMPRITANGTHESLKELNSKVNIIVDKQASFDTILNDVREDQKQRKALGK